MARRKVDNPSLIRNKNYCIRLTYTEWEALKKLADAANLQLSPMLRDYVLLLITDTIGGIDPC